MLPNKPTGAPLSQGVHRGSIGPNRHRGTHAATVLLIVTGSGAAGAAALATGSHPLAGLLVAVTVGSLAAKAYRRLRRIAKRIRRQTVVAELRSRLPDDYFLLNDLVVPGHGGNVDHVVVGPCGVVVIETKNFSGSGSAVAVREWLTQAHPDLAGSALRFVDSVVVFANPTNRVRIDRAQTTLVRHSQLLDVVLAKARRKKHPRGRLGPPRRHLGNPRRLPAGPGERELACAVPYPSRRA
jgi:hypothetical protein